MNLFTKRSTMLPMDDPSVNRAAPRANPKTTQIDAPAARKRLSAPERECQIVEGAIQFFARHGFDAQLRDLAKSIGVTHTLLYHYFPDKQALVDRVYVEVFEGCWKAEWEKWLDDPALSCEDKFTRFYIDYAATVLNHDFVRIIIFSGLTNQTITNRFFDLLRARLFPRLIRETRHLRGIKGHSKVLLAEHELLIGLHGSIFYFGVRRWVYNQAVHNPSTDTFDPDIIRNQVRGYLQASRLLPNASTSRCNSLKESPPWH